MTQKLKEAIKVLSSLEGLPEKEQHNIAIGVLKLVKSIRSSRPGEMNGAERPIWDVINELGQTIPEEELEQLPIDGASEHDHYIYGSQKQRP